MAIMPDRIHLTVATVIHTDNRFLMVRESDSGREVINQPAGHVEPGENLQQAALRETLEETGWQVRLTGFLGIRTYTSAHNGVTYYRVTFSGEPEQKKDDAVLDDGILAAEWLTPEQIRDPKLPLRSPMVLAVIEDYLAGAVYPLDLVKNH